MKALNEYEDQGNMSKFLDDRPLVFPTSTWIWGAFWILCSSRQVGYGPGPISLSDISAYCELFNVKRPRQFIRYIQCMDGVWLKWANKG